MRVEVLSVREARIRLPRLLERFRGGEREPVFLGSHRKTEAVMLSIDVYEELVTRRRRAATQAIASVRAEGMRTPPNVEVIIERWIHGHISSDEMEQQVAELYGLPG